MFVIKAMMEQDYYISIFKVVTKTTRANILGSLFSNWTSGSTFETTHLNHNSTTTLSAVRISGQTLV